jgi:hypothetical protein
MAIKVGGTWRTTSPTSVKVSGTWRATQSGWVRLSGVWREFVANTLSLGYSSTAFNVGTESQTKSATTTGGYTSQAKTFALVSGSLPPGVTLDTSSGVLTGPSTWTFPAGQCTRGASGAIVSSIVRTSDGGAIVAGTFTGGSIIFGATTLPVSGAGQTLFVAKISAGAVWLWAVRSSGTAAITGTPQIVKTSDNGVIVFGASGGTGTVILGSTTIAATTGGTRIFVTKVSSSGSFLWGIGSTKISKGSKMSSEINSNKDLWDI